MMLIPMIDSLFFSLDFENYCEVIKKYANELETLKKLAKRYSLNKSSEKSIITIGNMSFEVLANGANGYAFILHNSQFEIKLALFRSKQTNFYPVKVRIKSDCLWSKSPASAYGYIYQWFEKFFGKIIANKVSRADLCCHTDLLKVSSGIIEIFKGLFKKTNLRYDVRQLCGIEFGVRKSAVYCRIYNKSLEIKRKNLKKWFYDIWKKYGLKGKDVWNIEFELHREFFKNYGIESVEDLFNHLNSVWKFCTEHWLVLVVVDRTRIENCSVDPVWQQIANAFNQYVSEPLIKREHQVRADAEALIPATIGNITTVAARLGINNNEHAFYTIMQKGEKYLDLKNHTYKTKIDEKISLLCR